jgi:hypothetical protein
MNKNNDKKKKVVSPSQKGEKTMKQPLFKMFMNDSNRKLHLIKHNISNSKDSSVSNQIENESNTKIHPKSVYLNLQVFSYQILEAKHNSTPKLYLNRNLDILIKRKKCHLLADFNERMMSMCHLRDYLKRYYTYKETEERIPKYVSYYKNYLTFFCRPLFVSYVLNKKMVRHMEKVAQVFYNENYAEEEKEEKEKSRKKEKNIIIFNKKITKEIEEGDVYTVVSSEAAMRQIQKMNSLINKKIPTKPNNIEDNKKRENSIMKNKNNLDNNIPKIEIEELAFYDNNYKITPISDVDGNIEINTNEIISELKNQDILPQTTNSINLLIEEMQSKETKNESKKNKEENGKEIIKNVQKNCIVIQGGKTTNNINININHLTIGQKVSHHKDNQKNKSDKINKGLDLIKNSNSKNKIVKKFRNINANTKDVNQNVNQRPTNEIKEINTDKEKETINNEKNNFVLTLPPPSHNSLSRTNSIINKKSSQILPNTISTQSIKYNKDIKNANLFKGGYSGSLTSLHKYIPFGKGNNSHHQLIKHSLNTNYSNRLSNIFKNMNYATSKASKNINVLYTKNPGILTGERTRSISNMKNRQKRIIYSSLHFNGSNIQLLNLKNNIGTSKNSENRSSSTDKRIIEFKMGKEKIPLIKNRDNEAKTYKKGLKLKGKHMNLQKLLNAFPKKSNRARSTDN